MPPKAKFTKQELIDAGLSLVREQGMHALTARALGEHLGTSTRPIFTLYPSMLALREDVIAAAYALYHQFIDEDTASGRYPPYKAAGMAYIRFATEERALFELLFMRQRSKQEIDQNIYDPIVIERILQANDITRAQAEYLYLQMWICAHGIATLLATSYYPLPEEQISEILTDTYLSLRERIKQKESANERH